MICTGWQEHPALETKTHVGNGIQEAVVVFKRIFGVFVALTVLGVGTTEPALSHPRHSSAPALGDTLNIKGYSSSYVDVELAETILVRVAETHVATEGEYGGFRVESLSGGNVAGAVSVPAFDATGQPFGPLLVSRPDVKLEPGPYRVYLFADGPTVVRVPLSGATRSLRLRPVEAADVDAGVLDLATVRPVAHAARRVPVGIRPGSRVMMAALQVAQLHQASRMAVCVAEPGTPDCALTGRGVRSDALYPALSIGRSYLLTRAGGSPEPGPSDLMFTIDGAGLADALLGFYLVVHG